MPKKEKPIIYIYITQIIVIIIIIYLFIYYAHGPWQDNAWEQFFIN